MQSPPTQSFDELSLHATAPSTGGSSAGSDCDFAEAERLRKQRELKRKSRERKKRDLEELQATAAALEAQYSQLLAAKMQKEQQSGEPGSPTESRLASLKDNYLALREEVQELRDQSAEFKLKIDEYERFIATLDGQLLLVFQGMGSMPFEETREPRPTTVGAPFFQL